MKETRSRGTHPNRNKFVTVSCLACFFFIVSVTLFFHGDYPKRILSKFSKSEQIAHHATYGDKALDAWNNCLSQLHTDADIVFFGDSITRRGKFDAFFPDKTVCNLGVGSDTIVGMTDRVGMIGSVSPEKVFVMCGINSVRNDTLHQSISEYKSLLKRISKSGFPEVFILSVLPIAKENSESIGCSPDTIMSFNRSIEQMAVNSGFTYIDLHSLLASQDGYIEPELTTDGVHLTKDAYQIWADTISPFIN